LDKTASIWDGILVPQGHLDQESLAELKGTVRGNAKFPLPMARNFPLPHGNVHDVERFHNVTVTRKATSGSRYAFMGPAYDIHRRLQNSRLALERALWAPALPQGAPWDCKDLMVKLKSVKREQLDIFLEHCWLVFRARRNA